MITVFLEPVTKDFYAHPCSLSTAIYSLLAIFCVVFPFLAAFASERFWIRQTVELEHPVVLFNSEFVLFVLRDNKTYFYSSMEQLNEYYPRKLSSPSILFSTKDDNYDGFIEQFNLKIALPNTNNDGEDSANNESSKIQAFKLGIFFDYGFSGKVKLFMKSMLLLDVNTYEGLNSLKFIGDLEFNQKNDLFQGSMSKNMYNKDIINNSTSNPFDINEIYLDYLDRNLTNTYKYDYFEKYLLSDDEEKSIEVEVNIPYQQKVRYTPTYLYTMKEAWVQYFCIFVPVYIIIRLLLYFLFVNNVFLSYPFSLHKSYEQVSIKHKLE